jgi:putative ABC transport system permease protein
VIWFRDRVPVPRGSEPAVGTHWVSPGYLRALRLPMVAGRWFTEADCKGAPKVVVISQRAARSFYPNENPIGRIVAVGQGGFGDRAEIVGVVGDVRYGQVHEAPKAEVYLPIFQSPIPRIMLFVRAEGDPALLANMVRRLVAQYDRSLPVFDVRTLRDRMGQATARARFGALLLAVFAAIALALAAAGIYGVMSCSVAQRTREIGIRVALGALPVEILGMIMRRSAVLAVSGIAIGSAGALATTPVLRSLLYEVDPADPVTLTAVAVVLSAVALLASFAPALRATRVDAIRALRTE